MWLSLFLLVVAFVLSPSPWSLVPFAQLVKVVSYTYPIENLSLNIIPNSRLRSDFAQPVRPVRSENGPLLVLYNNRSDREVEGGSDCVPVSGMFPL